MATCTQGMAAADSFYSHPAAPGSTIFSDSLGGILRATRRKAAMLAEKGTQYQLVAANDNQQNLFHGRYFTGQI